MAGLEVLFASAAPAISCPQDALVCFLHWEVVTNGYYVLGTGDQPDSSDKKSELLPPKWSSNKELYVLRYESKDGTKKLLLKAVSVESAMIINVLEHGTQQVADLTLNLDDYIDAEDLSDFHRTYKNGEELRSRIRSGIITPIHEQWEKARVSSPHREFPPATAREVDPLRIPSHHPHPSRQPPWCQRGGMIVDPLRSGFPRALIDPSSGLPNRLPPGAVPPGARFDPFGPIGTSPSGPNPDHLPPPGYDDMYL
ncbi:proteasome inhibitor PI31 subunit isoform X2 [Cricetulus griseus]|uniref:Proteasome inhibitor PI31 subunit n=1 Tax=Cricetulus griseus TaxID=10029 RepID=A0A9J7G645_CRIGR|nr:proteasome inhibitor PI31 subunit isoform X2 [Cricetulus griseus]XP_027277334.1 proteasome inhibitor PI31 subunit isoform X2 [Cricetulus griseus]ERE71454.1 proteasome inhibitor PI31 subunit-like protein [Cricetulus griseus]